MHTSPCASSDYPIAESIRAGFAVVLSDALADAPCGDDLLLYVQRGKMVRAALAAAATQAVGGPASAGLTAAAVLECLHSAALIQDDIIDGAAIRRGAPALHERLGIETALMLADVLIGTSLAILARGAAGVPPEGQVQALAAIARCITTCARGQLAETAPVGCFDPGAEAFYLQTIADKTGSVFVAAATIGPMLSGSPSEVVRALASYGAALGAAFQVHDDVLDLLGDPDAMGKPVRNSLSRGRLLLPLVYLVQRGSREARAALQRFLDCGDGWDSVHAHLEIEGIWAVVDALERRFVETAREQLARLPRNEGTASLHVLAALAIDRDA